MERIGVCNPNSFTELSFSASESYALSNIRLIHHSEADLMV
jgi:hypothetical protein